jgi:hypothetical protein
MLKKHFKTCVSCDCPLEYDVCVGLHICDACKTDLGLGPGKTAGAGMSPEQASPARPAGFAVHQHSHTRRHHLDAV